jgi:hypothetical protein
MRTLLLVTMTVLGLAACATFDSKKKSATFDSATSSYSNAIRWGEYAFADSMRRLPEGQHALQPARLLEHIRVSSYETLSTSSLEDGTGVRVIARIGYYHDDGIKLETLLDNQVWQYDEEAGAWYITTPLPAFR